MVQDLKRNYLQENCKMKSTSPLLRLVMANDRMDVSSVQCNFTHNVRNLCYVD